MYKNPLLTGSFPFWEAFFACSNRVFLSLTPPNADLGIITQFLSGAALFGERLNALAA